MDDPTYTHVTIAVDDLNESTRFYEDVFDMEQIPTPDWDLPVQWLNCGGLQLHLVETEAESPSFHHFGVHVDALKDVYTAVENHPDGTFDDLGIREGGDWQEGVPPVYYLPTIDTAQMYIRDPTGNMIEVNNPDINSVDRSVVTNVVERTDLTPPEPGEEAANLYGEFGLKLEPTTPS